MYTNKYVNSFTVILWITKYEISRCLSSHSNQRGQEKILKKIQTAPFLLHSQCQLFGCSFLISRRLGEAGEAGPKSCTSSINSVDFSFILLIKTRSVLWHFVRKKTKQLKILLGIAPPSLSCASLTDPTTSFLLQG